jgi:superfamily I DNA and/or RNA helicase
MHPDLCAFPSEAFYGGRLRSAPTPADRPIPAGVAWPNPKVELELRKEECFDVNLPNRLLFILHGTKHCIK